jgi:hypothetical protein
MSAILKVEEMDSKEENITTGMRRRRRWKWRARKAADGWS